MRPCDSVTGTRCTRCGPPSCFMRVHTPSPFSRKVTSLKPPRSDGLEPEHLELPAHAGGVGPVHLEQVAGEEVGLLAALGAADLDDDVVAVVGVAGQQQQLELVVEPVDGGLGPLDLGPHQLAVVAGRVGVHLPGRGQVVGAPPAGRRARSDDGLELLVAPGHLGVAGLVGQQRRGRPGAPRPRGTPSPGRRGGRSRRPGYPAPHPRPVAEAGPRAPDRATGSGGRPDGRSGPPVAGPGDHLGRSARAAARARVLAWASRSGSDQHQAGARGRRQARASAAVGTRSRSMPTEATTTTGAPSGSVPTAAAAMTSLTPLAGQRALDRRPARPPRRWRLGHQPAAQPALGPSRFSGCGGAPGRRTGRARSR